MTAVSVQTLRGAHDGQQSFTVVDADALPIPSVEAFLCYLAALGYSPDTVKTYAHDLADLFSWGSVACRQRVGVRSHDISIVSFDDDALASYLRPGLTTAQLPYEQMGRRAMELLLAGPPDQGQHLIPMPLQHRDSIRQLAHST